jgi:hypothetical protein
VLPYILIFAGSLLIDCIPVFAPPAWMLMLYIMMKFNLDAVTVALVGTAGTVSGRLIYMSFIVPWIGKKTIGDDKEDDLEYLGKKLSKKGPATLFFIFLYSILPLSTTALFTAAGLAKLKKIYIVPAFFLGNLIGDGATLLSGRYVINNFSDFYKGSTSPKGIAISLAALFFVLIFLFMDWRTLLEKKKIKLKFKFWK